MYNQSIQAASRRRNRSYGAASGRNRKSGRSQETVRLAQLAVCLVLFLTIFLGKGVFPQKLEQVQRELFTLISTDFDFRGALSNLGESMASGDTVLADLGAFCVEVFGLEEPSQDSIEPEPRVPPSPPQPTGVLTTELSFLGQHTDTAARTTHYADLVRFGLEVPQSVTGSAQNEVSPVETVTEPEEPPTVPAAGTVVAVSGYNGPELPENYTMDQLSLGELETVTPTLGHLNSEYGYRDHPISGENSFHSGVDIGGQMGAPIAAFAAGTVEYTGENDSYGLYLQLDHGNGIKSFYGHCSEIEVVKGQTVALGDTIARVGSTGISTGPHLHFELKYNKTRLNPAYYVEFLDQ